MTSNGGWRTTVFPRATGSKNSVPSGVFVSVGNATQRFARLLDEVAKIAPGLPQPIIVQHGNTPFDSTACSAIPFVDMTEFERLVAEAELLILHAGAGSVIHAVRAGKIPVVMPRRMEYGEHIDNHQVEFAHALESAGRVVVAEDSIQLAGSVRKALALQRDISKVAGVSSMLKLIEETLDSYAKRYE